MKVDGGIGLDLDKAATAAKELEDAGYSGIWTAETNHDPFLPLVLAAEHTERVELGTSIAVAFARNPMTLANTAWDLQAYSGGRFVLGLGSQIKPHITKRFSMPWSHPAARMRELVLAIRAIWAAWAGDGKVDFRGDFYSHTLMTPFFNPGPNPHGDAKIFLAGVGELMTEVAGEVCDGFICHGFTTERYLREVTIPALLRGRAKAGKGDLEGFEIVGPSFVVTGTDEDQLACGGHGHPPADRLLRLDPRLPPGARPARLGRPAGRSQRHVQAGQMGGDGRTGRRRDPQHVRRGRRARADRPRAEAALRRRHRADLAVHALPVRPGALAEGAGRPPGRLTVRGSAGGRYRTAQLAAGAGLPGSARAGLPG